MELDPKYDNYDFPTTSVDARSGHAGHLNATQQAQVHQFRLMLESAGYTERLDTLTLLRFLRARGKGKGDAKQWDVEASKQMFIKSEEWRKKVTIREYGAKEHRLLSIDENPSQNPPAEPLKLDEQVRTWDKDGSFKAGLSKYYKQFYHKTDKDGRPCYFEILGGVNLDELNKAGYTNDKMLLNLAVEYEKMADPRLPACSRKAGHFLETSCTVIDVANVKLSRTEIMPYFSQSSEMSSDNYPERLGKLFVINTTRLQRGLWWILSNLLDPVTVSKIQVLGYDYKDTLLKHIPAENLPAMFGGSCQCEGGCELSDAGPWQEDEWRRPAWWEKDEEKEEKEEEETAEGAAAEGEEIKAAA